MLLYDPNATPLDLRFRVFGTHVRVHPLFWLVMGILGWGWTRQPVLPGGGLGDVALWIFCCFLSVLLHELGHVWMGQAFGTHGHILLHSMGGLAIGASDVPHRWQRILISLAGPGIQLLLYAVLYGLLRAGLLPEALRENNALMLMLAMLLLINLAWPILNLLPIWPLDGGQVTREVCEAVSRRGVVVALWISLVVSAGLAVYSLLAQSPEFRSQVVHWLGRLPLGYRGSIFMAIFFALFAVGSWQALQAETSRRRSYWDDDEPWRR